MKIETLTENIKLVKYLSIQNHNFYKLNHELHRHLHELY